MLMRKLLVVGLLLSSLVTTQSQARDHIGTIVMGSITAGAAIALLTTGIGFGVNGYSQVCDNPKYPVPVTDKTEYACTQTYCYGSTYSPYSSYNYYYSSSRYCYYVPSTCVSYSHKCTDAGGVARVDTTRVDSSSHEPWEIALATSGALTAVAGILTLIFGLTGV